MAESKGGPDTAFEVFIDGALTKIYNEAGGRSKELRSVREACKRVLGESFSDGLRDESGKQTSTLSTPLDAKTTAAVLEPLRLACATENPKLVEPALGCIHKLVSHAYLHAESTPAGRMDDGTTVAQVLQLVSKCGEQSGEAIQLAVLRALLTIATAEHFVVHGDCLMQSVRTAFNVAIGAESDQIKRTARNALLQMLNTIVKRVSQYPLSRLASAASGSSLTVDRAALLGEAAKQLQAPIPEDPSEGMDGSETKGRATQEQATEQGSVDHPDGSLSLPLHATDDETAVSRPAEVTLPEDSSEVPPDHTAAGVDRTASAGNSKAEPIGEEIGSAPNLAAVPQDGQAQPLSEARPEEAVGSADAGIGGPRDTRTAQLATLAEQADLRGLEKALDQIEAERGENVEAAIEAERKVQGLTRSDSAEKERDVRRVIMREKRQAAWRHLNLNERDVLTVLSAVCKMAARETGFGVVENLLHQGKLLALELLVRVMENPLHVWNNVRAEFCEQLRQYLWPALLRNSLSPYREAFGAVTRLLAAILTQQRIRAGLKVEIGAFYPLMLLRPLEAEKPDQAQQLAALEALTVICGDAQLTTDLFVNYDCNLQASNLFERTLKGVAKVIQGSPPPPAQPHAPGATPAADKIRDAAVATLLLLLKTLDDRAQPLKEVVEVTATSDAADELSSKRTASNGALPVSSSDKDLSSKASEVARFGAIKEKKHSLEAGMALFNRNAVKGMASLIASGTVDKSPAAIAVFLREHAEDLDTTQIGEYFGHHEEQAVAAMHAYIDQESYAGLTIDAALRELLRGFRLPGEAQKIDRIMEKFAERYCRDNEGAFASADGPYLLAFALIMLNTDAHNPRAEKKLACEDFVTMCQAQDDKGAFAFILPREELEAMYRRILEKEIPLPNAPATTASAKQAAGANAQKRGIQTSRLAAALGLSHMFRNANWDKQHGVIVERARLLERTREVVAKGQQVEHIWHTATHVEHIRPMLQVGGDSMRRGLAAAMDTSQDAGYAAPILESFTIAISLSGILGLDQLTEALLASLASAAGVARPAAPGSAAEAKQLAALSTLVALASGSGAGLLGSGWVTVLRTLSALDLLKEKLIHNGQRGNFFSMPPTQPEANYAGNPQPAFVPRPAEAPTRARSFGRGLLWRLGLAPDASAAPEDNLKGDDQSASGLNGPAAPVGVESSTVPVASTDTLFHGPGAVLVNWSENEGHDAIEQVFAGTAALNGDAVVVFVRALCAVSQEELVPSNPSEAARIYSLGRLMESAYHNLGRIRLIWGRLWAAVAPHLVSAACHMDANVAALAVDHMRRLIARLLARAELSNFTYQEDALRPLVSVLKHSDSSNVREQVVALISHSITAHPRGLGSGWRSVLQALTVAVTDSNISVVDGALDAIQAVTAALFRGVGMDADYFEGVCTVLETAMKNPAHERLSINAAHIVPAVAQRLASTTDKDWTLAAKTSFSGSSAPQESLQESPSGTRQTSQNEAWGRLAQVLALVARHDPRPPVADAALAVLMDVLTAHGSGWDPTTWALVWSKGLSYVLELPASKNSNANHVAPAGWSTEGQARVQRHAAVHIPALVKLLREYSSSASGVFQQVLGMLVRYVQQGREDISGLGVDLLQQAVICMAPVLDDTAWTALLRFLSLACSTELSSPLFRSLPGGQEAGLTQHTATASLDEPASTAAEVRCLCRTVVQMQRACSTILEQCSDSMPAPAQLHLLSILQDTVQRAGDFNYNSQRRLVATRLLSEAAEEQQQQHAEASHQVAHNHVQPHLNGAASRAEIEGPGNQFHSDGDSAEEESHAAAGGIAGDMPDTVAALMRQEAEGGSLLIAALLRCMSNGSSPLRGGSAAAAEAETRLLLMSQHVLANAAQQAWLASDVSQGGAGHHLTPEAFAWDQAIRAPLLEAVLSGYREVSRDAWRAELPAIWPNLAHLIVCPQPAVRTALASLLHLQLQPLLQGL